MDGFDAHAQPQPPRWSRKAIGLTIAGAIGLVVTTVIVTLQLTHASAVEENFVAYINGLRDGLSASEYVS